MQKNAKYSRIFFLEQSKNLLSKPANSTSNCHNHPPSSVGVVVAGLEQIADFEDSTAAEGRPKQK